jgi:hypothetical protein
VLLQQEVFAAVATVGFRIVEMLAAVQLGGQLPSRRYAVKPAENHVSFTGSLLLAVS